MTHSQAAALALALTAVAAAQANCEFADAAATASSSRSVWREYGDDGEQLLRERGTLVGIGVRLAGHCRDARWALHTAHEEGQRDYEGRTNRGRTLQTVASVATETARFEIGREWGFALLSAGVGQRWTMRRLASVGSVHGYTERYRFTELDAGMQRSLSLAAGASLDLALWAGWAPAGRVQVGLPGADRLQLKTGSTQSLGLRGALHAPLSMLGSGATWQLEVSTSRRDTKAGPYAPMRLHGVITGAARQPRIRIDATTLSLGVRWFF